MAKRVSLKGKGADLFFGDYPGAPPAPTDGPIGPPPVDGAAPDFSLPTTAETTVEATLSVAPEPASPPPARARTSRRPAAHPAEAGKPAIHIASKLASDLADHDDDRIEAIRQVVKAPGREVSFVRLSPEEKGDLADVVYTYKRRGLKTTENEINRIAINSLLADYRANGERSILARVLAALRA